MTLIAPTFQAFFTSYLMGQKAASPHTITAYRDTWRLLLTYLSEQHHIKPNTLDFTALDVHRITEFLTYLEEVRGNAPATRNARLAGIHAFFHYAAYRHPEHADLITRVLAIAPKNTATVDIVYLTDAEAAALLAAPETTTWTGRRDQLMIEFLLHTGLRVTELINLRWADLQLHAPAYVACRGKGRKERSTPINVDLAAALTTWWEENTQLGTDGSVFPTQGNHHPMSPDAITQRLAVHQRTAAKNCPSLQRKTVTAHILRHTTAMRMLAAGIDVATISLWLGHANIESTRAYLHADMTIKQRALDRTAPATTGPGRYKPPDSLLAFLENL
ncbi:tyrosine-type recombinase/integrase [Specibacter cremeus]|uniref:tyrosine-type recombinase/integrase n=1 Tax=Specibacter cremeus TaxID=1629051 RepID=UPI000F7754DE|nr:tyrosine-type recombinase/integrase [Specibacter cremeus]